MTTVVSSDTISRADILWSSLGPKTTPLMPLSGPTGSVLAFHGLTGLVKSHMCKQTWLSVAILSQRLSVAIIH